MRLPSTIRELYELAHRAYQKPYPDGLVLIGDSQALWILQLQGYEIIELAEPESEYGMQSGLNTLMVIRRYVRRAEIEMRLRQQMELEALERDARLHPSNWLTDGF